MTECRGGGGAGHAASATCVLGSGVFPLGGGRAGLGAKVGDCRCGEVLESRKK